MTTVTYKIESHHSGIIYAEDLNLNPNVIKVPDNIREIPLFDSLMESVEPSQDISLQKVNLPELYPHAIFDVHFQCYLLDGEKNYRINLVDKSDAYQSLRNEQQKYNEEHIKNELLRLKAEKLELENSLLHQEKRHQMEMNQQRLKLFAKFSHDLRTPANAISTMSNLLNRTGNGEDELLNIANAIMACSQQLNFMVTQLMDYSELQIASIKLKQKTFEFQPVLDSVTLPLSYMARAKGLDFVTRVHDVPLELKGDAHRLAQILFNVIGNAVKYTTSGIIEVDVSFEEGKDSRLAFKVKDTGIGIPENILVRIFDEYIKGDGLTESTGLGLSVVRDLIDIWKGDIQVESEVDAGTTVSFSLPIIKAVYQDKHESVLTPRFSGRPVAIIDDDPLTAKVIASWVQGYGAEPHTFSSPDTLLKSDLLWEIDAVTVDRYIAGTDRRDFIDEIRAKGYEKSVVLMSGDVSWPYESLTDTPYTHLVTKPVALNQISTLVKLENLNRENQLFEVDREKLLEEFDMSEVMIQELYQMFVNELELSLKQLIEFYSERDTKGIRTVLHKLRTQLSYMGLMHIVEYLDEVHEDLQMGSSIEVSLNLINLFYRLNLRQHTR